MDALSVSVIVPHFNDLGGLALLLDALDAQTYPREKFEIIIADNGSPHGLEPVRALAGERATVILAEERGAGPARNAAVAVSSGEVLAFIDSDCVPIPTWLTAGVKALDRFDLVGGEVTVRVADEKDVTDVECFEVIFGFDFKTYIERQGFTGSGNMFCRRTLFDHVGGFRVGLSEDLEWSRRAVSMGYSLGYERDAFVWHPARRTWSELVRKWDRVNRETYGLSEGRPGRRVRWLLRSLLTPASVLYHGPKMILDPRLHGPKQKVLGVVGLARIRTWRMFHGLKLLREDIAGRRDAGSPAA